MKEIIVSFRIRFMQLLTRLYGPQLPEDDEYWDEWVHLMQGNLPNALSDLVTDQPVREVFKGRALALLIISATLRTALTRAEISTNPNYRNELRDLTQPSQRLLEFVAEFVILGFEISREHPDLLYPDQDQRHYALILGDLLNTLDPESELVGRLWELRLPKHPDVTADVQEQRNWLDEMCELMYSLRQEKWQRLADRQLRQFIQVSEVREFRRRYDSFLSREAPPYDAALFAEQLEFLLEMTQTGELPLLFSRPEIIAAKLKGDEWEGLRHRVMQRILQDGKLRELREVLSSGVTTLHLEQFGITADKLAQRIEERSREADTQAQARDSQPDAVAFRETELRRQQRLADLLSLMS